MKKFYSGVVACIMLMSSTIQLNAQCDGARFHDFVFQTADVTSDITYGSNINFAGQNTTLKLDVYQPHGDTASLRPLIVWAHPGSFVGGSKSHAEMVKICTDFTRLGYVNASIDYRLFMTGLIPGTGNVDSNSAGAAVVRAVHDAKAAIRFFRKNIVENGNTYKIDTNNIYFGGLSAGALTALHLAYMDEISEFPSYIDTTGTTVGNQTGQLGMHGGIEGLSGNPGYSSKVKAILNLSGAISDTSWMHTGDTPVISTHATGDGTVPYGRALIYLQPPSTYPIQIVDGSSIVTEKANQVGIVNCFKPYYVNQHVPESDSAIYDTTLCLLRNFLEHFTCGVPLNCEFTGKVLAGVQELSVVSESQINVYPNPSSSNVTIDLSAFKGKSVDVEVYDAVGRKVKSVSKLKSENYTLTREGLPSGLYWLNIINNDAHYSKKIILE